MQQRSGFNWNKQIKSPTQFPFIRKLYRRCRQTLTLHIPLPYHRRFARFPAPNNRSIPLLRNRPYINHREIKHPNVRMLVRPQVEYHTTDIGLDFNVNNGIEPSQTSFISSSSRTASIYR